MIFFSIVLSGLGKTLDKPSQETGSSLAWPYTPNHRDLGRSGEEDFIQRGPFLQQQLEWLFEIFENPHLNSSSFFFWCCESLLNCLQLALRWFKPHFYFWKKKSIKLAKFLPQCSFISATILQPFSSPFSNNPAIFHQCFLLLLKTSPNPRSRSRPLLTVSTSQTTNWSSKIFMSWSLA